MNESGSPSIGEYILIHYSIVFSLYHREHLPRVPLLFLRAIAGRRLSCDKDTVSVGLMRSLHASIQSGFHHIERRACANVKRSSVFERKVRAHAVPLRINRSESWLKKACEPKCDTRIKRAAIFAYHNLLLSIEEKDG